jgi:hypothetical protein
MILLIQVPLKQKERPRPIVMYEPYYTASEYSMTKSAVMKERSDVENAVIGHGKIQGPFTEIDDLSIERDERYPIRVTVQFYKATSNGVVSSGDMEEIASQINKVYDKADYVGSLVTEGDTGRPTEYDGSKTQPDDWWENFWARHYENTGYTKDQATTIWQKLFAPNHKPRQEWGLTE